METVYVCRTCGSERVYQDAWANINDPEDVLRYDNTFCMDCEGETTAIEEGKGERMNTKTQTHDSETDLHVEDCGCRCIQFADYDTALIYCTEHRAAPDLLAAARLTIKRVEDSLSTMHPENAGLWHSMVAELQEAVRKAE